MSKNVVEPERPEMTIWRMRVACWSSKATRNHTHAHAHAPGHTYERTHTHTHTHAHTQKYVTLTAFPVPQYYVTRTLPDLL